MNPYTSDTTKEAEAFQLELFRKMSPEQRAAKAIRLSSGVMRMAKAAIRRQNPGFTEKEVGIKFIELCYGSELAASVHAYLNSK